MKKQNRNNKQSRKILSGFWGSVLVILLITVAFGLFIYGMYMLDLVSVFDISKVWYNNTNKGEINGDDIYEQLKNEYEQIDYAFLYSITPEELTDIVTGFSTPKTYFVKSETVYASKDKERILIVEASKESESYTISKYENDVLFETVQLADKIISVTDNIRNRTSKYKESDYFSFESTAGIPSLEPLIDICKDISNGTSDMVKDYEISVVSSSSETFYHIRFSYSDINQREEYFISTDTGMIVNAYTYIDGNLIYRYHMHEFINSYIPTADMQELQ